jgi:hypothetical protein
VRPAILDKLFAPLTHFPASARKWLLFERLTGPLVLDLLWHLPMASSTPASPPIKELQPHQTRPLRCG